MNSERCFLRCNKALQASALLVGVVMATTVGYAQSPAAAPRPVSTVGSQGALPVHAKFSALSIESGSSLFQQNCAFCHGKDAGGGESGPDLTRSKLVTTDMNGENISEVVRNGRIDKGMPRFGLSEPEILTLVAYIHSQQDKAMSQTGKRKGVDVSDLQTGDVDAGKQYFNGAGTCSTCHSPTGDLSGIATRYQGLKLEQQMLYPRDAKSSVTVTLPTGKMVTGPLAYLDEFTVALKDSTGVYHSWPVVAVKYKVDAPAKAHVELFDKYSDADIHNLMAYIQTLR
jgi:cytochrome c oxidase cbb3-type subunit 3